MIYADNAANSSSLSCRTAATAAIPPRFLPSNATKKDLQHRCKSFLCSRNFLRECAALDQVSFLPGSAFCASESAVSLPDSNSFLIVSIRSLLLSASILEAAFRIAA